MTSPPPAPALSVIIVNFDTRERLLAALDSLGPEAAAGPGAVEVIVVDNHSSDGSAAAARAHVLRPTVLEEPANRGFAAGVNAGLRAARGEIVVLLNSDARVTAGALNRLAAYLLERPTVGVAGGRVVYPDGAPQPTAFALPAGLDTYLEFGVLGLEFPLGMRAAPARTGPVGWVSGAFMALSRAARAAVGEFDERFFLYAEDIDWCRRARAAGFQVHYVAEATALHEARGSEADAGAWSLRAVAARLAYHRKHDGAFTALGLRAALSVNWLGYLLAALLLAWVPGAVGTGMRRRAGRLLRLLGTAGDAPPPGSGRVALVAIVDFPNGVGGDTRRVHMLARSLVAAGYPTSLVIPCPRGLVRDEHLARAQETIEEIDVRRLSARGSYGHTPGLGARGMLGLFLLRWQVLFRTLGCLRAMRRQDLRTIYLYQPTFYDGAALWLLARLTGCQIVADYCDLSFVDHDRIEQNLARRLWSLNYSLGMTWLPRRLDRAFVISRFLEERFLPLVPRERLVRVPPVVDARAFDVEPPADFLARRCGVPAGSVVLYAGSFFDNEGVPSLLAAAPSVLARHPKARFVIVGGHPAEALDTLRRQALALGLTPGQVFFPGVAPSLEMPLYFRSATVLVAPKADSPLNRAGVPTKLVEYLASGRPVVASAVGDIPLLVDAGTEALLVPPDQPAALAGAICALLDDPARAADLGEAGRRRVRADFDVQAIGGLIRRALDSIGAR